MTKINVQIKIPRKAIQNIQNLHSNDALWRKVSAAYRTAMFRRFQQYSMGQGNWTPLKRVRKKNKKGESTKYAKFNEKRNTIWKKEATQILQFTGTLMRSAGPSFKKQDERTPTGIRIKFPDTQHPNSKATTSEIATWQHYGTKFIPARPIFVEPEQYVKDEIRTIFHEFIFKKLK